MGWTPRKVRLACTLHASLWSAGAIAWALGMTRNAVIGKFHRLRRQEDLRMASADLIRRLAKRGGAQELSVRRLRATGVQPADFSG